MLSIMNEIDPCLLLPLCVLYEIQTRFTNTWSLLCPTTSQQSTNKQLNKYSLILIWVISTNSTLSLSLSLSLSFSLSSLYNTRESIINTEWQRVTKPKSQKAKKKKKNYRPQHKFNSQSPTSVISLSFISKNTKTPQAQIVKTVDSQTFY